MGSRSPLVIFSTVKEFPSFWLQKDVSDFLPQTHVKVCKIYTFISDCIFSITGWSGETCDVELESPCLSEPCEHNGTCVADKKLFHCACPVGWTGSHCEVNINECASNPCMNGVCVDKEGRYQCFCIPGNLYIPSVFEQRTQKNS